MGRSNNTIVIKGQKRLRCGYTTGTCAAAAAKAAAAILLSGFFSSSQACDQTCQDVCVTLPNGNRAVLELALIRAESEGIICGIIKDAGDDPDITNGMMICAHVMLSDKLGIHIDGGQGVGRVTKPGLDQPVGAAAINSVPRRMITEALSEIMGTYHYTGGLDVIISIPGGEEKALKTLNPTLGIEGGLSVLGTSGIVEPMSERALIDTIGVEIRMHRAHHEDTLIMAPGNYGLDFLKQQYAIEAEQVIKISNYIGDSVDLAVCEGAAAIVLVGHIGKLIKLAGGIMNTHSRQADARMEILTAYGAVAGADIEVLKKLMTAVTTDAGLDILDEAGLLVPVIEQVVRRILYHLQRRAGENMQVGVLLFSNVRGLLGMSENAETLLKRATVENENKTVIKPQ